MIITKRTTKPTSRKVEIDEVQVVTYHGGQATDYAVKLFCDGVLVREKDVRSVEDGIAYLHALTAHPKNCRCNDCEDEGYE